MTHIKKGLAPIQQVLAHLKKLDARCQEAKIEENDHTIYTYDDLEYAFNLAKASVDKKLDFIQNQVSPKNTNPRKPLFVFVLAALLYFLWAGVLTICVDCRSRHDEFDTR